MGSTGSSSAKCLSAEPVLTTGVSATTEAADEDDLSEPAADFFGGVRFGVVRREDVAVVFFARVVPAAVAEPRLFLVADFFAGLASASAGASATRSGSGSDAG